MEADDLSGSHKLCAESAKRARLFRKWDPCRFRFLRELPAARRHGVELYTDALSGRTVAAKRFPRAQAEGRVRAMGGAGPGGPEAAWPEVVLAQRLGRARASRDSGVCACLGAFRDERGDVLLVTEYVPGGDLLELAARLGQPGPERERLAWPVILALLRSVLRLHARGITHRDVSLENALLRPGPRLEVLLIDLELAVGGGRRPQTGVYGKLPYQAPEMHGCRPWDGFAADLFACGVAAYGLAVGSLPWRSTAPHACGRFASFAEHGFPAFAQQRLVSQRNCSSGSVAECLSPHLSKLLEVLLSWKPEVRQAAVAFLA